MKTLPFNIRQQAAFRVLLIGVFFGLLFSCGEGIQLFPFSEPDIRNKENELFYKGDKIPYQLSLHRFENTSVNLFNKQQSKQFPPLPYFLKAIWQPHLVVEELVADLSPAFFSPFKQQVDTDSISNRAPPV